MSVARTNSSPPARAFLALALALLSGAVQAQVHRCPDAGGRVLLQQAPCAGGHAIVARPQPYISTDAAGAPAPAAPVNVGELDRRASVRAGLQGRYPVVTMSADELWRAMGTPDDATVRERGGATVEQRTYRRGSRTHRVTLTNGTVTSVAERQAASKGRATHCPSALAIRNAAVAANSLTLSAGERTRRQRDVQVMRDCRSGR